MEIKRKTYLILGIIGVLIAVISGISGDRVIGTTSYNCIDDVGGVFTNQTCVRNVIASENNVFYSIFCITGVLGMGIFGLLFALYGDFETKKKVNK